MKKNTILSSIILVTFLISIIAVSPVSAATVGLVGEWNFDEGSGSIADDSSTNANDGVLSGGKFGNALEFDGIDDNVFVDGSALDLSGMSQLTLEAWVYVHSYPTTFAAVVTKWYQSTTMDTYGIWISSGHKLVGGLGPQIEYGLYGTSDVTLNTWHYVALVYNSSAGTAKLYLDGALEATRTGLSGNLNSADNPLYIGCDYYGIAATPYQWRFFDGRIDEARISNTAHTISGLPASAFSKESDTVALWHFDESTGTSTTSDSDIPHPGIINDATWAGPTWVPGYSGSALRFDGVDDYVLVSGSLSLAGITSQITVDAWVNFEDVRNAFYVRTPYDSGLAWGLDRWGGLLRFHIYDGSVYKICSMAWTPTINTWYHIAGTYDGTTLKLYLDGVLSETFGYTGDIDPTGKGVVMGARYSYGGADFHKGLIDEVHIWDVAISDFTLAFEPTSPSIVPKDAFTELTVCLKDNFSNIVPGVPVTFTIDNVPAESVLTGADGTAKISVPTDTVGVYAIKATAETFLGDRDAENYVVVYDPSAGFVTGGGWIDSPAGAYAADPELTGKASFGFVSKYKKGANVPTGNTEFIFHTAEFKFKSTSYEWLVIAGYQAKFKGEGEVNGEADYKFMLSATDGGKDGYDTFRIKIWDSSEVVVYDNKVDENDETVLGGGSIIVHKK